MSGRRITEIDFVRGLCILCVHMGHCGVVIGWGTRLWQTFFMSAFFLFSGYLGKQTSFGRILRSTLLLYYLWGIGLHILRAVPRLIRGTFSASSWLTVLGRILLGTKQPKESEQLWFLITLFTVEVLWFVITHVFKEKRARILTVAILLVAGIILNARGIRGLPFRLGTALMMLPLFVLGQIASEHREALTAAFSPGKWNRDLLRFAMLVLLWCFGAYVNYRLSKRTVSVWSEHYNTYLLFYLNAVTGTAVFLRLSQLIDRTNAKILTAPRNAVCFYGRNSRTAFLTVNFLILIVGRALNAAGVDALVSPMLGHVIKCAIVVLLQIPVAYVLNRPVFSKIFLLK